MERIRIKAAQLFVIIKKIAFMIDDLKCQFSLAQSSDSPGMEN
jgi:hypothetical protein